MLADSSVPLMLGDRRLMDARLASVPDVMGKRTGDDIDRTMLVNAAGRTALGDSVNRVVEVVYELVRRSQTKFVSKPSRLTCTYAYSTLEAAAQFRDVRRGGRAVRSGNWTSTTRPRFTSPTIAGSGFRPIPP